jgi:serine/threonine protein kinase/WD40 repeat protein
MNERSVFAAALDIADPKQRAAYLDEACASDPQMRRHLDELLAAEGQLGSFLAQPPVVGDATGQYQPITERPGTVIGPYRLMEQIGEGGMGLVFVAEQQEPVRRKVALKVIKPGMDTRDVIARFEAERQALALMDHPNIARVLDAGATDSGRPYFVMELVKGIPITDYCDQHQLTPRERLELFISVCQAVQHAHTKGVIHRDLKPSNILIAPHDGKPVVKVIDFGVAKAIGQPLTDKTIYTRLTQMIGTPLYMSPEQAEINALDVDTRSDVYALAVLLYELLTGTTPFDRQRFGTAAFDEIRRIIREEEPPKPSTRLSELSRSGLPSRTGPARQAGTTSGLASIAAQRKTEPGKLSALVKGDLDWIVMKGLDKDRTRRYETASALAADVQRYLKDEAIEARPPSAGYRLRKLFKRNRGPVLVTAVVLLALVAGAALSLWQAVRATRAEAAAAAERDDKEIARKDEAGQRKVAIEALRTAQTERDKAEAASEGLRRALYVSQANLIQNAWDLHDVGRVLGLLEQQRPGPDETDLRGFEWHYFDRLCHADLRTLKLLDIVPRTVPGGGPLAVAFSADGEHCATANPIKVWNVASGVEEFTLPDEPKHAGGVGVKCALSQHGERLVVISRRAVSGPGAITVWDVKTRKVVRAIPDAPLGVDKIISAISPDGRWLAADTGRYEATITIWDLNGKEKPRKIKVLKDVRALAFTADGKQLVVLTLGTRRIPSDKGLPIQVTVFNRATGEQMDNQGYADPKGPRMALSHDGSRLILGGSEAGIFDTKTGKPLASLQTNLTGNIVFSLDGQRVALWSDWLASAGQIWDVKTGRLLNTIKGHTASVVQLAFNADGSRLYSVDARGTLKEWDVPTPDGASLDPGPIVKQSKDGTRQVVRLSGDATVIRIRDAEGKELLKFDKHHGRVVYAEISANGAYVLSGANVGRVSEVKLWETATGKVWLDQTTFNRASLSADGRRIAAALPEGGVKFWELDSFREIFAVPDKADLVQWSADGRRVLTFESVSPFTDLEFSRPKLWDVDAKKQLYSNSSRTLRLALFSPDGKRLALVFWKTSPTRGGGFQGSYAVKVLDVTTGAEVATFGVKAVPSLAFSPDHNRLAAGNLGADVIVWDIPTSKEVLRLKGHSAQVNSVAYSPDGKRLASVSRLTRERGPGPYELILWDIATGSELMRRPVTISRDPSLSFSPDGHRLSIGGLPDDPRYPPLILDATPGAKAPLPKAEPPKAK